MSATSIGNHHLYGIMPTKELTGFPEGKKRIRMRRNSFLWVFVKTSESIRQFKVKEIDGKWTPGEEQAQNLVTL